MATAWITGPLSLVTNGMFYNFYVSFNTWVAEKNGEIMDAI